MKFRLVLGVLLVFLVAVTLTGMSNVSLVEAELGVHNVDTGEDFATIQEAIDDANTLDGHTILVDAGIYNEAVTVSKSLILQGEDKETTIIDGTGTGYVWVVKVSVDNVVVTGFTIRGGSNGIMLEKSNNSTLVGNTVTSNGVPGSGDGIKLENSNNSTLVGNTVTSNGGNGIRLYNSGSCTLVGNTATNHTYYGISLTLSSNNNTFTNNIASNNGYAGISIYLSSNNTFVGTTITNNDDGISLHTANNNMFTGNTVADSPGALGVGIKLLSSSYNTFTNNTASSHREGVSLEGGSNNNTFAGNTITNNTWSGMSLRDGSSGNSVYQNNITLNSEYGVYLFRSSDNTFYHNNLNDNRRHAYVLDSPDNIWDNGYPSGGNYWDDYEERYPNAMEIDGSGIWDTPYVIDENNQDNYPIVPEFPTWTSILLILIMLTVAIAMYKRRLLKTPIQ